MLKIIDYIQLIRIKQWYKNIVVFLPIFFVGEFFSSTLLLQVFLGFIALSFMSSVNYVINDFLDIKRDKKHPEKKERPLASGRISVFEAIIVAIILFGLSIIISLELGVMFLICVLVLFGLTLLYSIYLKKEAVADVIAIALNFVVRAISGTFIINVFISPWLIVCPFFLALFLAVGKREADLRFLKGSALQHKEVLKYYTIEMTSTLMVISTTCLIISYSLYSFSKTSKLLLTLPFAIYAIFRYYYLIQSGSEIARHPEKMYKDIRLIICGICLILLFFLISYANIPGLINFI
ncbi:MAG: UbiA prenyltransferase family protein [Candidatus Woesearchaeota archaeon]|jgi:4-hydroxybenzoate polyprenyltransferase